MKCWVCADEGNSGEHFIKASDIKLYFPEFNQKKPLYISRKGKINVPIGSKTSYRLKSNALICKTCNSTRTQAHDLAWEKLSKYIVSEWHTIEKTNKINLKKVFPRKSNVNAINIQLYILKLFGCALNKKSRIGNDEDFVDTPDRSPENLSKLDKFKNELSQIFANNILSGSIQNQL